MTEKTENTGPSKQEIEDKVKEIVAQRAADKIPRFKLQFETDKVNKEGLDEFADALSFVLLKDFSGKGVGESKKTGNKAKAGVEFLYNKAGDVKRAIARVSEYDRDIDFAITEKEIGKIDKDDL